MEIKNCPICGYDGEIIDSSGAYECECTNVFCGLRSPWEYESDDAITAWNEIVTAIELGRKGMGLPKVTKEMITISEMVGDDHLDNNRFWSGAVFDNIIGVLEQLKAMQEEIK